MLMYGRISTEQKDTCFSITIQSSNATVLLQNIYG